MKFILALLIITLINNGRTERTKDKMYEKINGSTGCFRRLNATHQIGCSSKRGGSTGVVHFCQDQEDLDFILKNGIADSYIPVIPTRIFSRDNVNQMVKSHLITGLVLYQDNKTTTFSQEDQCPNERFGLRGTCKARGETLWNPHGTGMLHMDIPFPVFYVEKGESIDKIRDCFDKFNNYSYPTQGKRSLCSLQLQFFMYATKDTPTCLRRSQTKTSLSPVKTCDPLGDNNIWAPLFPLENDKNSSEPIKYIVLAARMDTTTMFDKSAGANSPVTGMVTLLSVAKLLKTMLPKRDNFDKNVLFIFFNGETYDYMGSQRMVYDMANGNFPIKDASKSTFFPNIHPKNISLFIELSQLSNSPQGLNAHVLKSTKDVNSFIRKLKYGNISAEMVPNSLPPSSLHTFIANESELNGVLLADHKHEYANQFYNSIYDNVQNIKYKYMNNSDEKTEVFDENNIQKYIANISTMIARAVFQELTDTIYKGNKTADANLVDELFHCYLEDPNCKVDKAIKKAASSSEPSSLYVGVAHIINFASTFTALTLGWLTGDVVGLSNANCTNDPKPNGFKYYVMAESLYDLNNTVCFQLRVNTSSSVSPAFVIEDYDWTSGKYSSWTESTWDFMDMQMFLKPSSGHEKTTIAIGLSSFIFSFLVVYFVKSRSQLLFTPPLPTEAPIDC